MNSIQKQWMVGYGNRLNWLNETQKKLAVGYGAATLSVLLIHAVYQGGPPSLILTFTTRLTMVAAAFMLKTKLREKRLLRTAFLFTLVSDFFFIFLKLFARDMPNRTLYGMLGFIIAYLFLILTFIRTIKWSVKALAAFVPFGLIFLLLILNLRQFAAGMMYPAGIGIGVILSITGMVTVSTLFSGYFTRKAAWFIALAGSLMFFSDLFVAYSIYDPAFAPFMLWKENMIWGTYVPAWTLLLLLLAEDNPYQVHSSVMEKKVRK